MGDPLPHTKSFYQKHPVILGALAGAGSTAIIGVGFWNPLNITINMVIYWVVIALVILAFIVMGLIPADFALLLPRNDEEKQSISALAWERQDSWVKALTTVSTLILTGCGAYFCFFLNVDKTASPIFQIKASVGLLALTASFNLASALILPLSEYFYCTWAG